jgi:hypothetical protein
MVIPNLLLRQTCGLQSGRLAGVAYPGTPPAGEFAATVRVEFMTPPSFTMVITAR